MSRLGIGFCFLFLALVVISPAAMSQKGWLGIYPEVVQGKIKVDEVIKGSPAEKAGFKAGDLVVGFNGAAVANLDQLVKGLRGAKVGQKVGFTLLRGGKKIDVTVTLGRDPEAPQPPVAPKVRTIPAVPVAPARPIPPKQPRATDRPRRAVAMTPAMAPRTIELRNENQLKAIAQASVRMKRPLLIEFTAPWAGPAKTLQANMKREPVRSLLGRYLHVRINVDKFGKLADRFKVDGIPHLEILAPGGKKRLGRVVGVVDSKRVAAYLKRYAGAVKTNKKATRKPKRQPAAKDMNRQILNELRLIRQLLQKLLAERQR